MFRFSWARVPLVAAAITAGAALAPAQSKVAVISLQRAIVETAEIKKAQADLEAKYKPRQDQIEKLQREIQTIQQQLQTMAGKLTQQAEQEMTTQGQRKQRDLQRSTEDLQAEVDRERNDILQRAGQRFQVIVKKLAEEKGIDVVVESSNTIFFKPALDITTDAIAAYDKAYPLK